MLSRLSRLICCGASSEARNSGDVVVAQAGGTRANDECCDELTGSIAALKDEAPPDFVQLPENCGVREFPSSRRKTQARQILEQDLETPPNEDAPREPAALHAKPPKPSLFSAPECMPDGDFRPQPRAAHNPADTDPLSGPEEGLRPSTTSSISFIEPHSPFMASAAPAASPRGPIYGPFQQEQQQEQQQQQQQQTYPLNPPSAQPTQPQLEPPSTSHHSNGDCPSTAFSPSQSLPPPPPTFLCAAGSGMQPLPRHLASIISSAADMQLTTSLSEPLVTSSSPGSDPPHNISHASGAGGGSSSVGTAITAFSVATQLQTCTIWTSSSSTSVSASSGAAAAVPPPVPVAATKKRSSELRRSADRLPLTSPTAAATTICSGARERRITRGSMTVERSGGSRLGRPELAVLGAAASASASSAASATAEAGVAAIAAAATATAAPDVTADEPKAQDLELDGKILAAAVAAVPCAASEAATGKGTMAAVAGVPPGVSRETASGSVGRDAGGGGGGATPLSSQTSVGGGGGCSRGSRGIGAFAMLGDMTRRLLHIVQDVGSAVSQVALLPATLSRNDGAAAAPAPAATGAAAGRRDGNQDGAAEEMSSEGCAGAGAAATGSSTAVTQQQQQQQCYPQNESQQRQQQDQQQQQQQQQLNGADNINVPPSSGCRHATVAATAVAGGGGDAGGRTGAIRGGGAGTLYPPYVAARGSLRAGSDSGSMAAQRMMDDTGTVQLLAPYVPLDVGCSSSHLPKQAARDISQVALMQMLHFGSTSGRVPLHHLATLNVTALSKEIRALHWVGQGGGGAVFQGVWQGAPVAVKFMLAARPEHVDATALEAIVSLTVGHPNVVTTYSFDVTRLTESSFMSDAVSGARFSCRFSHQHLATTATEDCSATALLNALMDTETALEPWAGGGCGANAAAAVRQRQQQAVCTAAGAGSRPGSMPRVESLNMRIRRVQAAAALASGSGSSTPSAEATGDANGGASTIDCAANGATAGGDGTSFGGPSVPASRHKGPQYHHQNQHHIHNPRQQQQHGAAVPSLETLGIESAFNSEEGFGDPDLADSSWSWTVRHVLAYLKARPGMYMTHIIMEYCDRGSLLSAIKRGVFRMNGLPDDDDPGNMAAAATVTASTAGPPSMPRFTKRVVLRALLRTARDVAQGMCHLHANGIIHGDLKPGNVLLRGCRSDRRGFTALVSDFGLSKVTRGDKPLELNHWSTVTVMAPEVIMGCWLKASDVFSFGILLWQLVTGEIVPYGNATVQQVLIGVAQGVLKPEWPSSAHPALVRLGRACLATSPEKRPSFDAIVKILIKVEKNVRNELRPRPVTLSWSPGGASSGGGSGGLGGSSSQRSRSSASENKAAVQLNRLRSAAI